MRKPEKTCKPNRFTRCLRSYGAAVAAALLVLMFIASGIVSFQGIRTVRNQDVQVDAVRSVLVVIGAVYTDLHGVEADAYDFVITGNPTDLQAFLESRQDLEGQLSELQALVFSSAAQQQRLTQIQRLIPVGVTSLNGVVRLREAGNTKAAMQMLTAGIGIQTLESGSSIIDQMVRTEDGQLNRATISANVALKATKSVVVVVFLGDLILLAIISMLARQAIHLREQLAEELAHARTRTQMEVLEETNRRMDEFLSIASHEFRTPLTTLKANLQLAARRLSRPRPSTGDAEGCTSEFVGDIRPLIERASQAANRLERLAGDLLDMSRIKAGELVIRPFPFDLAILIEDCVAEQRLGFPGRVITQDLPTKPTIVVADPDRIRQAIANYLTNALKFSGGDKPVRVLLSQDGYQARVAVLDSGPGLPEGETRQIWERFQRAPGITPKSGSHIGLGLGLYITKTIIERHGGQVGVDSKLGEGATFWFTLPLSTQNARSTPMSSTEAPAHGY